jgi:hypothetical protein
MAYLCSGLFIPSGRDIQRFDGSFGRGKRFLIGLLREQESFQQQRHDCSEA